MVSLKFDEIQAIDSGEYTIKAANSQGSCLCSAEVSVIQSKTKFLICIISIRNILGQSYEKEENEIQEVIEEITPAKEQLK